MTSSSRAIALALVGVGCLGDDSKPLPPRRVTAHALVWNGRDQPADGDFASTTSVPRVYVFDSPVGCSAIPRGAFDDAPTNGVRLEVVVYPEAWASGARAGSVFVSSFDADGRDRLGDGLSFTKLNDAVVFVTAPKERGSRATLRLDMQMTVDDQLIHLPDEIEAEVCGDIQ